MASKYKKLRLSLGRLYARVKRFAARRNLTTFTGLVFGTINAIATVTIFYVPMYFRTATLAEKGAVWAVIAAYVYQFIFKAFRSTQVDQAALRHDLDRKLIERRLIGEIHKRLKAGESIKDDRRLLENVLEAVVSKVAEKVGGYKEQTKLDANLVIPVPTEKIQVIARYGNTRDVPKEYRREERFCSEILTANPLKPLVAGDLWIIDKKDETVSYRDVLSIPVLGSDGAIISILNIDSTEPHHFPISDRDLREIEIEVSPYTALIRMILES